MHQIAAELYNKIQDFIWIDWGYKLSYKTKMEPVWSLYCSCDVKLLPAEDKTGFYLLQDTVKWAWSRHIKWARFNFVN